MKLKSACIIKSFFGYSIIVCIIILNVSCRRDKSQSDVSVKQISPEKIYKEINDSVFLSNVVSIEYVDDNIYLVDIDQHLVIRLDSDLNYIQTIGGEGQGPGELLYPLNVFNLVDGIIVQDAGNRRFNRYSKNIDDRYIFKKSFTNKLIISDSRSALIKDGMMFLTFPQNEKLPVFYRIDLQKNDTITFGQFYAGTSGLERNYRRICSDSNYFISVGISEPIVEVYSFSGEIINRFDLSDIPVFKETLKQHDLIYKKSPQGATPVLINDVAILDSTIYILITERGRDRFIRTNKILVFEYQNNDLLFSAIWELGAGRFDSFCVLPDKEKLVAFNGYLSELQIFNLE